MFYRRFSKDNGSSFYGSGGDPRDPTNPPSSHGGGSGSHGGGGGGDKHGWMCPNCGEICSHVDLFICEFHLFFIIVLLVHIINNNKVAYIMKH